MLYVGRSEIALAATDGWSSSISWAAVDRAGTSNHTTLLCSVVSAPQRFQRVNDEETESAVVCAGTRRRHGHRLIQDLYTYAARRFVHETSKDVWACPTAFEASSETSSLTVSRSTSNPRTASDTASPPTALGGRRSARGPGDGTTDRRSMEDSLPARMPQPGRQEHPHALEVPGRPRSCNS